MDLTVHVDGVEGSLELEVPGCPREHDGVKVPERSRGGENVEIPFEDVMVTGGSVAPEDGVAPEVKVVPEDVVVTENVVVAEDVPTMEENSVTLAIPPAPRRSRTNLRGSSRGGGSSKEVPTGKRQRELTLEKGDVGGGGKKKKGCGESSGGTLAVGDGRKQVARLASSVSAGEVEDLARGFDFMSVGKGGVGRGVGKVTEFFRHVHTVVRRGDVDEALGEVGMSEARVMLREALASVCCIYSVNTIVVVLFVWFFFSFTSVSCTWVKYEYLICSDGGVLEFFCSYIRSLRWSCRLMRPWVRRRVVPIGRESYWLRRGGCLHMRWLERRRERRLRGRRSGVLLIFGLKWPA